MNKLISLGVLVVWSTLQIYAQTASTVITLCPNGEREISCGKNEEIYIERAFWGRKNSSICTYNNPQESLDIRCSYTKAFGIIWDMCNGKGNCKLKSDLKSLDSTFCPLTTKYLQVVYRCGKKDSSMIGHCNGGKWTDWMNRDQPNGDGDYEITYLHRKKTKFCRRPIGLQVQTISGKNYLETGDYVETGMVFGAVCRNEKQRNGTTCSDYRVRVCCPPKFERPLLLPCGGNFTNQNEGTIVKSKYDRAKVDDSSCTWTIETDPGSDIQLEITELTSKDCVEIVGIGTYCSKSESIPLVRGNRVNIIYQRSGKVKREFRIKWKAVRTPSAVACPAIAAPFHGEVSLPKYGRWEPGDVAVFSCNKEYQLEGSAELTCKTNGRWSGSTPACKPPPFTYCNFWGAQHYTTFDNVKYDFEGSCTYSLVKTKEEVEEEGLTPFTVEVTNTYDDNDEKAVEKQITVKFIDVEVQFNPGKKVKVDGVGVSVPYKDLDAEIEISISGTYIRLDGPDGIVVMYDGSLSGIVALHQNYKNHITGLCGNFDGKTRNEFVHQGTQYSPLEYGNLFKANDAEKCPAFSLKPKVCSDSKIAVYSRDCGMMTQAGGLFRYCHMEVDPSTFFESCKKDMCDTGGSSSALEISLKAYMEHCQQRSVRVGDWRTEAKLPYNECGTNSVYSTCTSPCKNTCADKVFAPKKCGEPCREGCQCLYGYVFSEGETCVKLRQCGCTDDKGQNVPLNSSYYTKNCEQFCSCEFGELNCKSKPCRFGDKCGLKDGIWGCQPTAYSTCHLWGNQHMITYDNHGYFNIPGTCTYYLTKAVDGVELDSRFSVRLTNERITADSGVDIAAMKKITVNLPGKTKIVVHKDKSVFINGKNVTSYESKSFSIWRTGTKGLILKTAIKLMIFYDGNSLRITLPSSFKNRVSGLCGNYNGKKNDDSAVNWKKLNLDKSCSSKSVAQPACKGAKRSNAQSSCSGIKTLEKKCDAALHSSFYAACMQEACAQGSVAIEEILATYARTCQAAGVDISHWRNEVTDVKPMSCPESSVYRKKMKLCPATCQNKGRSCSDLHQVEGCQCKPGFLWDIDSCVPYNECGCTDGGNYYTLGHERIDNKAHMTCTCTQNPKGSMFLCQCHVGYEMNQEGDCVLKCKAEPIVKNKPLPPGCDRTAVKIGVCPSSECSSERNSNNTMEARCCGLVSSNTKKVMCDGYPLTFTSATQCGCMECTQQKLLTGVVWKKVGKEEATILKFVQITYELEGKSYTKYTNYEGKFMLAFPQQTTSVLLHFKDLMNKMAPLTKSYILPEDKMSSQIKVVLKILNKAVEFSTNDGLEQEVKSENLPSETEPLMKVQVDKGGIKTADGTEYHGKVKSVVSVIDNRDPESLDAAPGDLISDVVDQQGQQTSLRSYGMLYTDFRDEDDNPLTVPNIKLKIDASKITNQDDLRNMRLWTFDEEKNVWHDKGRMDLEVSESTGNNRSKRQEPQQFIVGNLGSISASYANLDILTEVCYLKVRTYADHTTEFEIEDVKLATIVKNMWTNTWRMFKYQKTGKNGVCSPVPCSQWSTQEDFIYLKAFYEGKPMIAANLDQYENLDDWEGFIYKLADDLTVQLFPPQDSVDSLINGPLYSSQMACEQAPLTHTHVQFHQKANAPIAINPACGEAYIRGNPLCWRTSPLQTDVCYMKVKVNGKSDAYVMSTSLRLLDPKDPKSDKEVYGVRGEQINKDSFACVEFKCSDILIDMRDPNWDNPDVVTPLVHVNVRMNECKVGRVNDFLSTYSRDGEYVIPEEKLNSTSNLFQMFAPKRGDPLGGTFGTFSDKETCENADLDLFPPAVEFEC